MSVPIHEYFIRLDKAIAEGDRLDDVIHISTQIIDLFKGDKDARHCRAIAYLQAGEYALALSDLSQLQNVEFETAYCLYALGRLNDSLSIIDSLPEDIVTEDRFSHLKGQVLFKLNRFEESSELYQKLNPEEITPDDKVNIAAALSQIKTPQTIEIDEDSPVELLYNTALAYFHSNKIQETLSLIEKAQAKSSGMNSQLLILLKAVIESDSNVFSNLSESEDSIQYVKRISALNYIALNCEENVHAAKKKFSLIKDLNGLEDMNTREAEAFLINNFFILHKLGQHQKLTKLVELAKSLKNVDPMLSEVFAHVLNTESKSDISPLFEAQTLIESGDYEKAARILRASKFATIPRGIAVISELYKKAGMADEAIAFLKGLDIADADFYRFAGKFAVDVEKYSDSLVYAEKYTKLTKNSDESLRLLSFVYSFIDEENAERYEKRIKRELLSEDRLNEIENSHLNTATLEAEEQTKKESSMTNRERKRKAMELMSPEKLKKLKEKKRLRRKAQKQKGFDKDKIVDPERWIKKKNRSAYKKRKQAKKQVKQPVLGGKVIEPIRSVQNPPQKKGKGGHKKGGKSKW